MDDKFIELLTKKLSGEITPDELTELHAFLNKNAIYKNQYNTLKMYWESKNTEYTDDTFSFQKVKAKIAAQQGTHTVVVDNPEYLQKRGVLNFWIAIAAVLFLCTCTYLLYINLIATVNPTISYQKQITPRRSRSIITLSDGTRITLNSESTLKYPSTFSGATREVYLTGEAFFDVHKDHQHPFIIHTGKMSVKVLGTEFNVRSYPNEMLTETSLIRGSIEVTLSDRPSDHIILKPTEKLIVKNNNIKSQPQRAKDLEPAEGSLPTQYTLTSLTYINHKKDTAEVIETAWLKNKLVADNEEFGSIASKMERQYGINIHFSNPEVEKLRLTATFEKETIVQALDALRRTENFRYKIDKDNVYIY